MRYSVHKTNGKLVFSANIRHQYSYNANDRLSHYAKHIFDENHNFNDEFEILSSGSPI